MSRARALSGPVLLSVAALGAVGSAGCRRGGEAPAFRATAGSQGASFTDEAGRTVTPHAVPSRRVVSLAPNVTELLFAIGAGDQVVGIDTYSDEPAEGVAHIPKVGSNYEPSLERIVALKPDVVVTSQSANRLETVSALERLGVPVFVTDTRGIPDMDRIMRNLGALTGRADAAEEQIGALHAGLAAVRRRASGLPRARVLVVVWGDPLYVAGRETFTNDLIEAAGGINVAADAAGFAKYPMERVLRAQPEVIILPTHSVPQAGARAVSYWSRWPDLPAVRTGRVHAVDDALTSRPGARLVAGAELFLGFIQPAAPALPGPTPETSSDARP